MPPDKLSLDAIVGAAITVLDSEGVAGFNLRRLSTALGVAPSAVYWHVKGKDDVIVLAGDRVWHEIVLPPIDADDWRRSARELASEIRAMLGRHRWLVTIMSTHVIYGPGKARVDDHTLGIYESAGFSRAEADGAAMTMLMFIIGAAQGDAAEQAWQERLRRAGGDDSERVRILNEEITAIAERFPRLRERAVTADTDSDPFEFGLRVILDGLDLARARDHHQLRDHDRDLDHDQSEAH